MCVKEPAGFYWLFVHPHPESFPSVTAKVIYTVVGPRGTRQDQGTAPLLAELSLGAQDVARQETHETSGWQQRAQSEDLLAREFCQLQTASSPG